MTPGPMAGSGFAPAVVGEPESMVPATRGGAGTAATEPPASKMPIPEEHLVLQEVFDGLRSKCVVAANHPVRDEPRTKETDGIPIFYNFSNGVSYNFVTFVLCCSKPRENWRMSAGSWKRFTIN